jgi:hypothetical protein
MSSQSSQVLTRREALCKVGNGFGMMALVGMLNQSLAQSATVASGGAARLDYPQRVKRVIFLFMNGGMSQVDTFDRKPMLDKYDGQPLPPGFKLVSERKTGALMKSPFSFKKYGQCGIEISELWPHLAEHADDICWIRSVQTDIPNHEPGLLMVNTGAITVGRPSMGAWLTYGLGTENQNLPGFIVLSPDQPDDVGPPLYGNAFLPPTLHGTYVSDRIWDAPDQNAALDDRPVTVEDAFDPRKLLSNINNPRFTLTEQQREMALFRDLEKMHGDDQVVDSAIKNMELAYRMQTEAPDVFDIRKESPATLNMYGSGSVARGCLTAVRLMEKGVRAVQIYHSKGDPWDHHEDITNHRVNARNSDRPFAAVIKDLKLRGLWKDTLILCGSEFGRTPVREVGGGGGLKKGRDHNIGAFTMWMAGGAVKGGLMYGTTDDFGLHAVENPVHIHDIHATILYLMGIDHTKLTYRFSGRDFRLTDVAGNVIKDVVA